MQERLEFAPFLRLACCYHPLTNSTMRRELLLQYLAAVVLAVCVAVWFSAMGKVRAAKALLAEGDREVEQARLALKDLQANAAKERAANKPALSDAEVLELARLRNEVTRLRGEQRDAARRSTAQASEPTPSALVESSTTAPGGFRGVATLSTSVLATIGLGQSLAVGGWKSPVTGKRIVALVTPELHRVSSEPPVDGVAMTTHIVEMPNSTFEQLGLGAMWSGQAGGKAQATLTQEQMKVLLERAKESTGTDILSAPRVVTWSGREAQVSVSDIGGDGIEFGPTLNITPTLDAARTSVRLDLKFRLNLPPPAAPGP